MVYLFVILGILSCSLSQLLLKKSAKAVHTSKIYEVFIADQNHSIISLRKKFIADANEGRIKKGQTVLSDEEE